jgi:anti-sigma factor RsiW
MSCPLLRERLTLYAEEMLDDQDRRRVEEHLAQCQECRTTLDEIRATRELLRRMPAVELPEELVQQTADRIRLARSRVRRRRPASVRPLTPRVRPSLRQPAFVATLAAAALVIAFLWGLGIFNRSTAPPAPTQAEVEQDLDFYLREHALSAEEGTLTGDNFSWLVVASDHNGQK